MELSFNKKNSFISLEEYLFTNKQYSFHILYGETPTQYTYFFPPTMPILKIETKDILDDKEIAYFQEITTTYQDKTKTVFIDSNKKLPFYPFYTIDPIFIDIPLWDNKIIKKWTAKIYIFEKNKLNFKLIATAQWGFEYNKEKNTSKKLPLFFQLKK